MAKLPALDLSGRKGLAQYPSQSIRNAYAIPDGFIVDGIFNPFIRYGFLSPATSTTTTVALDQSQNSHFKAAIYDAVNDDFYFGSDALFRGDTTADVALTRVLVLPGSNADTIRDLEIYQVNGVRKMFVPYQTAAGKADIAISSLPYDSSTDNPTWLTGTVSGAFTNDLNGDIFMQTSDNGFAYLFLENQVYKIDGTGATGGANGTISSALLFPVGYKMVDVIENKGKQYIALHAYSNDTRSNNPVFTPSGKLDVGVYVWDRQTTVSSSSDFIPLPGFNVIHKIFISPTGKIRVLATDTSGYTMLLEYNGSTFQTIQRIGFNAFPLYRDALGTFASLNCWFGKDGILYMYGPVAPGDKEGLYKLYSAGVASTNGGIILTATGTIAVAPAIYLTYQDAASTLTNTRLKIFTIVSQAGVDITGSATVTYPVQILPKLSVVNSIRIFGAPCATTGSTNIASIKIYLNQSTTPWATKLVSLTDWSKGYLDLPVNKPYVNQVQLEIVYASGQTIGTSDFAPAYGEIDYTATDTNK